jgi:hypothetical protein
MFRPRSDTGNNAETQSASAVGATPEAKRTACATTFPYLRFFVGVLAAVVALQPARADERLFGYVLATDTMPQGRWEQQDFLTAGLEKSRGDYQLYQLATGFDYGITNNLQGALYLNSHLVTADRDSIAGRTSGFFVPRNVDPNSPYTTARLDGASFAFKYRLLSPYMDGIGLAFAVEPTLGPTDTKMEYDVIGHKTFDDDTVTWATNLTLLQDWQHVTASTVNIYAPTLPGGPAGWLRTSFVEFSTGLSVRVAENWFAGAEFRNSNEFNGPFLQQAGSSAFFLGPDLHYGGEKFWVTLAVLPQLPVAKAYSADQQQVRAEGRIYGDEFERLEARLSLGIQF